MLLASSHQSHATTTGVEVCFQRRVPVGVDADEAPRVHKDRQIERLRDAWIESRVLQSRHKEQLTLGSLDKRGPVRPTRVAADYERRLACPAMRGFTDAAMANRRSSHSLARVIDLQLNPSMIEVDRKARPRTHAPCVAAKTAVVAPKDAEG